MTENELSEYVECYRGMVFRLAYSYLKNSFDAEDVSQQVFLKLYLCEENFKSAVNVKAWLIRVTINHSKNMLKSVWRKQRVEIEDDIPDFSKEDYQLLDVIGKLKSDYWIVIHLFYYEDYSVKEMSDVLGISSAAVRTRLTRARNQLKKLLLKEGLY